MTPYFVTSTRVNRSRARIRTADAPGAVERRAAVKRPFPSVTPIRRISPTEASARTTHPSFRPGQNNELAIRMVFQGLTKEQAEAAWEPFFSWIATSPQEFSVVLLPRVVAIPARRIWDASFLTQFPNVVVADDRSGAPDGNFVW